MQKQSKKRHSFLITVCSSSCVSFWSCRQGLTACFESNSICQNIVLTSLLKFQLFFSVDKQIVLWMNLLYCRVCLGPRSGFQNPRIPPRWPSTRKILLSSEKSVGIQDSKHFIKPRGKFFACYNDSQFKQKERFITRKDTNTNIKYWIYRTEKWVIK